MTFAFDENERSNARQRANQEGFDYWKRQKEAARLNKIQEQKEAREMLESYWPWSTGGGGAKPRGLRDLRLEEIYPNNDYIKAKRLVSPLGFGRPGGGAPMINRFGRQVVRTVEDPDLRFQFGKDLRKVVDNILRYKAGNLDHEAYKKELDSPLDKQVTERKSREKKEKHDDLLFHQRSKFLKSPPWGKPGPGGTIWRPPGNIGINFLKSLGWSTERTLKALEKERQRYKETVHGKERQQFNQLIVHSPTRNKHNERMITAQKEHLENIKPYNKLSPLNKGKVNGEELVSLLAKQRVVPLRIPLGTTDVTRGNPEEWGEKYSKYPEKRHIRSRESSKLLLRLDTCRKKISTPTLLRDLTNQIDCKNQRIKELKTKDVEVVRRHIATLNNFWGRPGNGAPRTTIKKGCLDRLLHDHTVRVR